MLEALSTMGLMPAPLPALVDPGQADAAELRPVVRAVVACILREPPDAPDVEDATSEALRRALESKDRAQGPLRPFVLGIARHVALDVLRARVRARARTAAIPEAPASSSRALVDELVDPGELADERIHAAQRAARVRRALATLPEGPRRALELFHLEGLAYQEIAVKLAVPLGTVATWVTRGRRALAESLEDEIRTGETR